MTDRVKLIMDIIQPAHTIADCHCDTISLLDRQGFRFGELNPGSQLDLPRLRGGGVAVQFFAICVAPLRTGGAFLNEALRYLNLYHRCLAEHHQHMQALEQAADLAQAESSGKIGCLLTLEGAEPLEGSLELMEIFFRLGVRSLSLTWNNRNWFADGCSEEDTGGGLTRLGRKLIPLLDQMEVILDLAHLSSRGFFDTLALTERPPLVSHANARRLCDHPRNLTDSQVQALAEKGGVVGLCYYPPFVNGQEHAALDQLVDHFVHLAAAVGVEHLAIGSDFDGITSAVEQLDDASCHAALIEALYRRGFQAPEVELIAGGNVRRLLRNNLPRGAVRGSK